MVPITTGIAYEVINHTGDVDNNLLIIINNNNMFIFKNVGSINRYLSKIIFNKDYIRNDNYHIFLNKIYICKKFFEKLGFSYINSINGHDVLLLIKILRISQYLRYYIYIL
ncbi:1-deoxy-D-xylulose-5-phosphate synthase N-terminal domain-containing protein [Candidatus Purcelliella pentastirinorum]|uniref:1-deoxy-D-xylulose-5-phosphate synthase N-terminal domain-containing protein n=1 Tax=Candidatus Purcelliella pentastirinorum TaxID=472834 RepID=UPI002A4E1AD7|nr:1-deoxy-D-xylulose-5-phosphate synthase N-terminal domain-containing protein [Candidatus Purcelliella pentastirinorum]